MFLCDASAGVATELHIYTFQPSPSSLNIELFTQFADVAVNPADPWFFVARYTDKDNYYSAGTYRAADLNDKRIFKKVASVVTELASGDEGTPATASLGFNLTDAVKALQLNGADVLTTADNVLTSIGRAGFGLGNAWTAGDSIDVGWALQQFECRQDFPSPGPDTRSSVKSKLPQVVQGEGPPQLPVGDVLPAAPVGPAAAAPATINHEVIEPQFVAVEAPPLPVGDVLAAIPVPPAAPTFNQHALVAQFVAGDAPPFPVGDVLAAGGHPPVVTFNQHVEPQIVRGQEPPFPGGDVLSAAPVGPAVAFNQHALIPQLVAGEAPPFPAGAVLPAAGPPPAAPTFNQNALVAQFVAGDAPPFPGGDVLAAGGHPPVVTFNQHVEPQIVRGQEPPLPVGAVVEPVTPPGPTPAAPLDFGPMVPLVEAGEGPSLLPIGAVLPAAPPPPAAPTFNQHVAPQIVRGQEPPLPVGDVLPAAGPPPAAPTFNQHVEPQIVRGQEAPFPVGDVVEPVTPPGPTPAAPTDFLPLMPMLVAGEAPPFPVGSVDSVGQFHTGAEFAVPKAGRGFLSRPFLG